MNTNHGQKITIFLNIYCSNILKISTLCESGVANYSTATLFTQNSWIPGELRNPIAPPPALMSFYIQSILNPPH